ncbi:diguanylate cyclase [Marinomonas agarivorans]|nr:diguanylate cyclase [Marinomonas agarivorans]
MLRKLGIVLLILCSFNAVAENLRVKKVDGQNDQLIFSVLELAMSKADNNAIFVQGNEAFNSVRASAEVEAKNLDVFWSGASPNYDANFLAVRIPVLKGLLGHRIFIIRAEDENKFAQINSFSDLTKFDAGQGTFWGDTKILKNAQIPTVTTIKYGNLFPMLEGGRFDYFPRAVHEPWVEVKSRPELNLVVEKNTMLIYPFAMYFYVHKDNQQLHDKIYKGFEMAINDGSFDELFFNNPMIKDVLSLANLSQRKVIRVDNPFMHPDTPNDRKEFWLDVENL